MDTFTVLCSAQRCLNLQMGTLRLRGMKRDSCPRSHKQCKGELEFMFKVPINRHPILFPLHFLSKACQLKDKMHVPCKSLLPNESPGLVSAPVVSFTSSVCPAATPGLQGFLILDLFTFFWGSDEPRGTSISKLRDDLTNNIL